MPVLTVTGLMGAGGPQVGEEVARILNIDYVDRLILAEAARKIGTTEDVVDHRIEHRPTFGNRLARLVRAAVEHSAYADTSGDWGDDLDPFLAKEYRDQPLGASSVTDTTLLEVTSSVIRDIARSGNAVIQGRGSNMILKDEPGVLHVGVVSALEGRIERVMERVGLDPVEAKRFVDENDKGRIAFYRKFFNVDPEDPRYYHIVLNTDLLGIKAAASATIAANARI